MTTKRFYGTDCGVEKAPWVPEQKHPHTGLDPVPAPARRHTTHLLDTMFLGGMEDRAHHVPVTAGQEIEDKELRHQWQLGWQRGTN